MTIRRIALTVCLTSVAASAILVGLVSAQQTPPTQQKSPTQQTGPAQQVAPGGEQRPSGGELDCEQPGTPQAMLRPFCEATTVLIRFIRTLHPFNTSNIPPSCNPNQIALMNEVNLKVNAAINYHKVSDKVFDDPNPQLRIRSISNLQKAEWTTENDIKLRIINEILNPYAAKRSGPTSQSTPLIYQRELIRYAEEILDLNNKLSGWGHDARFLTAARGYAIYQFIFDCVKIHDVHRLGTLMAARAHAVRRVAESESFFSEEVSKSETAKKETPREWQFKIVTQLLRGSVRIGTGFPDYYRQIYLGSGHSYSLWETRPGFSEGCPAGEVRNFYGKFRQLPDSTPPGEYMKFEIDDSHGQGGVLSDCEPEINSRNYPAINIMLTPLFKPYVPGGGEETPSYRNRLAGIRDAINGYIMLITDQKRLEQCLLDLKPFDPGVDCKRLAANYNMQIAEDYAELILKETRDTITEFRAMGKQSNLLRDVLSPPPSLRSHPSGGHWRIRD
jgi:hypothetical protein